MMPAIEVEVISKEWIGQPQHPEAYEAYSFDDLLSELHEIGRREGKPGLICSLRTLRTRIDWINQAVPWFFKEGSTFTAFQKWVVVKYHRAYYHTSPKSHRKIAQEARKNLELFTPENYTNENYRTQNSAQSQQIQLFQTVTPTQS